MDGFEMQAAAIQANRGGYRELERIVCECSQPNSTIAIVYAGEGGLRWLWTPEAVGQ